MRYLFSLILIISLNASGADLKIPALSSPVMDLAGILSEAEKNDLSNLAYEINTQEGPQITILTVPDLQDYPIEDFSIRVAEKWKLGTEKKDNGILVVIAKDERQMRIEVGNGIEGEITDYDTAKYTKKIFPEYFRLDQYHTALRSFMEEVAQKFNIKTTAAGTQFVRRAPRPLPTFNMGFVIIVVIILSFISMIFRKSMGLRGVTSGIGMATVAGLMGFPIMLIIFLFIIGILIGLVGMGNVLAALASGHRGSYGGGRMGSGVGGWSGGGGGFSGGGSSGSW